MKKLNWNHKNAVVTGASSGIGEAIARKLAKAGIKVILVARRGDRLKQIQSDISAGGGRAEIAVADLSQHQERERIFECYQNADVLVNNAGFGWYGFFTEMTWETAQAMLLVNDHATVHLTRLFLPEMVTRKRGHIINMSSIVGSLPSQGVAMYSASKAFLDAFTTAVYRETRGTGVQVSLVRPGAVKTDFFRVSERKDNAGHYPIGNDRLLAGGRMFLQA